MGPNSADNYKLEQFLNLGEEPKSRIVGPPVGLPDLDPHETQLGHEPGRLNAETYDERGILISVLVVNADTLLPGRGFFELVHEHPCAYPTDTSEDEVFIRETRRVYEHYGRRHG